MHRSQMLKRLALKYLIKYSNQSGYLGKFIKQAESPKPPACIESEKPKTQPM